MPTIKISPSLLSCDFTRLQEEIKKIEKTSAEMIHFDIMDGCFVPNITIGPMFVEMCRPLSQKIFDVHLMIKNVPHFIEIFLKAGADRLAFHVETTHDILPLLNTIKDQKKYAGLAISPQTSIKNMGPYLHFIDYVIIMTVEPGFGGQSFLQETLSKIEYLASYKKHTGLKFDITVDGGINMETAQYAIAKGAETLVAGTAIFKGPSPLYEENIKLLRSL